MSKDELKKEMNKLLKKIRAARKKEGRICLIPLNHLLIFTKLLKGGLTVEEIAESYSESQD